MPANQATISPVRKEAPKAITGLRNASTNAPLVFKTPRKGRASKFYSLDKLNLEMLPLLKGKLID